MTNTATITETRNDRGELLAVEASCPAFSGASFLAIQIALEAARPDLADFLATAHDYSIAPGVVRFVDLTWENA